MVNLTHHSSHLIGSHASNLSGIIHQLFSSSTHNYEIILLNFTSQHLESLQDIASVRLFPQNMATTVYPVNIQTLYARDIQTMRDGVKFHHKMEESLLKLSKKFHSHHKLHRTAEEVSMDGLHYHHNAPIHLRHLMSHSVRHHGGHQRSCHEYMSDDETLDDASHCRIRHGTRTGIGEHHKIANFTEINYVQRVPRELDATSVQAQEGDRRSLPSDDGAEVIVTVFNGRSPSEDDASALDEFKQTAAETTLPWKCSFSEEPISSSQGHELQDGSEAVRDAFERSMWMNEIDYAVGRTVDTNSLNYSASELSVSENDHSTQLYSSMTDVPQQLNCGGGGRNYASEFAIADSSKKAQFCSRSTVGCFDHDDDANYLPLPWRTSRPVIEIAATTTTTANGYSSNSNTIRCGGLAKSNSVTSAEVYASGGQDSAMLPLPWRNFSADRALPDQQAPRRSNTTLPKPSHNSSAASLRKIDDVGSSTTPHDHDSYSVHPQASCHSFRLSEAESRHSESITHQHHMIEIVPQRQGLDWYDLSEGSILDMEQMDSRERVSLWLMNAPDCTYDGTEDFSSLEEF